MAKLTVADLEVLFTANTEKVEKAEKQIVAIGKKIESKPLKIDADTKGVLGSMDRVEGAAKKLVSERAVLKLDADVTRAEKNLGRAIDRLEDLHIRAEGGIDVTADVKRAESSIQRFERQLEALKRARNVVDVEVEVEEQKAESNLKRFLSMFKQRTAEAGDAGGRSLTEGLDAATRGAGQKVGDVVGGDIEDTLIDALTAIPVAGGIVIAGVAIGKAITGAIEEGLAVEKNTDRLQGLTGISEADALRLSRAAGEAYANNFGDSIESNMDTARLALQFRILDPSATTRDAQLVVQGLAGIADVLEEDVRPTAQAVTQLLSTGMAKNAQAAYDLIAAGARNGLNRNEDLLDTLTEYPALFKRLGLSGEDALGLINQGMQAGARNSDLAADALKEFQIRASEDLPNATLGFDILGMSVEDSMNKVAAGGATARETLAETLTRLREMEPGVDRTRAAMALFGTQAEDLGDSLFAMNLDTAAQQLGQVQGAAQKMFDTLASNDASKIEQAQRNIEVAADGIKGALASVFAEPLGDFADWVSQNRGPILQFFQDLVNGAIDFSISATEGVGAFVAGPLAEMVEGLAVAIKFFNWGADTSELDKLAEGMRGFESTTDGVVSKLESMRGQFNDFTDPLVQLGYVNDAALRTADAVSQVGYAAEGGAALINNFTVAQDGSVRASGELKAQLDASAAALLAEYDAAIAAGESQENLQARYYTTRDALLAQLTAMGMTQEQAQALIDTVLQTPDEAYTAYSSNADAEAAIVDRLTQKVVQMPDGSFVIVANGVQTVENQLQQLTRPRSVQIVAQYNYGNGTAAAVGQGTVLKRADGGPIAGPGGPRDDLVPVWGSNGEHMLTAREVQAMGGHGAVYRLRRAMLDGSLRLADGGPVSVSAETWSVPDARTSSITSPTASASGVGIDSAGVGALIAEVRALRDSLGRPNVSFINPESKDAKSDAWEAVQILDV
ncbi:phage-related minor tail protein [Microbacterium foliorum]|uniref:Phage-related minor tail protein n=1 Tax=Microbacterium foliorum TaxID=104336 RepID=A0ABU1HRU4_9MICO|nr:phage tail tape measure protein [Microbacterium foliorum]MDR6142034.1 phage-related minor tail protein [Microbacterium foliorum]